MAKFRKKPVIVDAEQYLVGRDDPKGLCRCDKHLIYGGIVPHVHTAHGQVVFLTELDWVIAEPDGRGYYPCRDDLFWSNYDRVEE